MFLAKRAGLVGGVFVAVLAGMCFYAYGRPYWVPVVYKLTGKRTVSDILAIYGASARTRLRPFFDAQGVPYPPERISLLASKDEATLELWSVGWGSIKHIRTYPIQALSGNRGPKLREGDRQVPEGFYRIIGLNPNSAFHLSMKLDYPNAFDRRHAQAEGRDEPGSNIFIHGKAVSIGCLAVGDRAIEELFVLVADIGLEQVSVVIAPHDPRLRPLSPTGLPGWTQGLYRRLQQHFRDFR